MEEFKPKVTLREAEMVVKGASKLTSLQRGPGKDTSQTLNRNSPSKESHSSKQDRW
jgi:hypothetical protein